MLKQATLGAAALILGLLPFGGTVYAATGTTNLINNGDIETINGTCPNGTVTGWDKTAWSDNNPSYTCENTGHTGNHSLKVSVAQLGTTTANDADGWYFTPVNVTAGQSYEYSFWYQSNVAFQVDMSDGAGNFLSTFTVPANTAWSQYKATFTATTTTTITFTSYLASVGYVTTDDYALYTYTATPFAKPIVSVTFDDGWTNQYTNGRQLLLDNGIHATFYLISQELQNSTSINNTLTTTELYMNAAQAQQLLADGNEIASHTIDHCSMSGTTVGTGCQDPSKMTTEAATAYVTNEMTKSKNDIQAAIPGAAVNNFAYPYGEFSNLSTAIGAGIYTSQRTVECSTNTADSIDYTKLKGCEVDAATTVAQAQAWIDNAIAQKSWLVLFFHEIADQGKGVQGDEAYTTSIATYKSILEYIKAKQTAGLLDNMTVANAITTLKGGVVTPPATKAGDANGDNKVDIKDATLVSLNWGKTGMTRAQGDLNGDGSVGIKDATLISVNWGK